MEFGLDFAVDGLSQWSEDELDIIPGIMKEFLCVVLLGSILTYRSSLVVSLS